MNQIRAVIFDLDDTLYNERQFVESGFKVVAEEISLKSGEAKLQNEQCYKMLCDVLKAFGRGRVFDIVLERLGLLDDRFVNNLVNIYRNHEPDLTLYPDSFNVLYGLKRRGYKLGLITDGNVTVQKNKLLSLNIENFFDCIVFSDQYGVECRKPNSVPYQKAVKSLKIEFDQAVYVGDNPQKDFITAKKLGIHTVRILRGMFKDMRLKDIFEADLNITSLGKIFPALSDLNNTK